MSDFAVKAKTKVDAIIFSRFEPTFKTFFFVGTMNALNVMTYYQFPFSLFCFFFLANSLYFSSTVKNDKKVIA